MITSLFTSTSKAKHLNIEAVQLVMTRFTMPSIRRWMKDANPSLLKHDFVATIHTKRFEAGTLGAAYHEWLAVNNLTLNPISEKATRFEGDPGEKLFVSNLGILHDLLHVSCGYGIDTKGEAQMAAWTHGNLVDQGQLLLLCVYALFHPWVIPSLLKAYHIGRKAIKATQLDWEKKVIMPLGCSCENTR